MSELSKTQLNLISNTLERENKELRQKLEAAESERDTYKEDLFQLRQKAENWSTKLGFVTSAINSRSIGVSEKERDFPHLLIERLHTESQLYKQKFERSESALREALEQKPAGKIVNWIDARRAIVCGDGIASSPPNAAVFLSPVPAMPVQDDKPMPIETAPLEGEFLAERSNGEWLIVHNQKDVFKTGSRIVCHGESGRFWAAKRWMPLVKYEVKPS